MKTKTVSEKQPENAAKKNFSALFLSMLVILLFVFITVTTNAQITIKGKVTDTQKQELPGVQVLEKGTSNGTVTDVNGEYKIIVQTESSVLQFSFISMKTEERKVKRSRIIDITLENETLELEEVVAGGREKKGKMYIRGGLASSMQLGSSSSPVIMYDAVNLEMNDEDYSTIHESGFRSVSSDPLSTFSIDVDNAAYSNVRRYLNLGQRPPVDAVRIEEMINYFHYDYKQPVGDVPFAVEHEYTTCPWNVNHNLLLVALQGKDIEKDKLPPSNLVFLLDVSGSMNSANKLPLVKSAMRMLVDEIRAQDKVAIVVYAGAAGVVLEPTSGDKKSDILKAIDNLNAGGSTAGGEGILLAYKIARQNFMKDGNNRIILATDGDFNVGVSSNSDMEHLVEKERDNGVFLTVLGFGMGNYKDSKLETLADKGNGNYAYIDNIQEARKVFIEEFGGTLFTLAKDVKFQLEFNPRKVKAYRLIGYENRALANEDFNNDKKDAGELGAGHTVTALYEIVPASSNEKFDLVDDLKYQSNEKSNKYGNELLTVKLRYKTPEGSKSMLLEEAISDKITEMTKCSNNVRFASSVAQFGMLLRDSEFKGTATFESTLKLAKASKGNDDEGYRGEFIRLVDSARSLDLTSEK